MIGVLEAINTLDEIKGKTDQDTHQNIKRIIEIMEGKSNKKWPSVNLCKIVFKMNPGDQRLFLEVLQDMDKGLEEYYG